jgi:hypothetical protein
MKNHFGRLAVMMSWIFIQHSTVAHAIESKRSKSINFEDELVEGINRKPLDQFNQISEINGSGTQHLYRKRKTFRDRTQILKREWKIGEQQ